MWICRKCGMTNNKDKLRPSTKVKGLTIQESKTLKMCAYEDCKGRIFYTGRGVLLK